MVQGCRVSCVSSCPSSSNDGLWRWGGVVITVLWCPPAVGCGDRGIVVGVCPLLTTALWSVTVLSAQPAHGRTRSCVRAILYIVVSTTHSKLTTQHHHSQRQRPQPHDALCTTSLPAAPLLLSLAAIAGILSAMRASHPFLHPLLLVLPFLLHLLSHSPLSNAIPPPSHTPSSPLTAHASTHDGVLHLSLSHPPHPSYHLSLAGLPTPLLTSTELIFTLSSSADPTLTITVPVNPTAHHDDDEVEGEGEGGQRTQPLSPFVSLQGEWTELDEPIWMPPTTSPPPTSSSPGEEQQRVSSAEDDEEEEEEEEDEGEEGGGAAQASASRAPAPPPTQSRTAFPTPPPSSSSVKFPVYARGVQPLLSVVMIVKNEALGLQQTLDSTYGHVDHYCLVDTGSTDGTVELIERFFSTLPATVTHALHHEPFVDFSTTRNRALHLTGQHTEFVLMMNGDDRLVGGAEMRKFLETRRGLTAMDEAIYIIPIDYGGIATGRSERLARTRNHFVPNWPHDDVNHWRFEGVTHEAYVCNAALHSGAQIIYTTGDFRLYHDITYDTAENKDRRFALDIDLLLSDLHQHPQSLNAPRNMFYLAQSYYNLDRYEEAWEWYEKRVNTNYVRPTPWGEDNEKHRSYTLMAGMAEKMSKGHKVAERLWKKSWEACPAAWSLLNLAKSMRDRGEMEQARSMADKVKKVLAKGSPVVCNGDDSLTQKQLPLLLRSLHTTTTAAP